MAIGNFRWGILGLGSIARRFAAGLQSVSGATLQAVGSRSQDKAEAFGEEFGALRRYGSYQALAADLDVDAVYIATPHSAHQDDTLLCLRAGKPVLCEKPFAINAAQAQIMIAEARARKLFLMEAMWTRFFPLMRTLRERLDDGAIGEPRLLQADFGFRADYDPEARLFNPALGGGALLDVGIYPVSLASALFGRPTAATGLAHLGETGIDEQAGMLLQYERGQLAVLSTAVRTETLQEATIVGTAGSIRVHSPWWQPRRMTIRRTGADDEILDVPYVGNGYNYEAEEVMACIRNGRLESSVMPLEETLVLMQTLDTLRASWGLRYPME